MILKSIIFGCILLADLHLASGVALDGECSATSECAADDTNAICDGEPKKCVCDGAYKDVDSICVPKGLEDSCSAVSDCASVTHAECASDTCQCSNGYKANGATACDLVYGMTCSETVECEGLDNSVCSNDKCACAEDYEASNNICSPESGAVSTKSAVGLVFGSVILLLIQAL